jgi:hypothetical protein
MYLGECEGCEVKFSWKKLCPLHATYEVTRDVEHMKQTIISKYGCLAFSVGTVSVALLSLKLNEGCEKFNIDNTDLASAVDYMNYGFNVIFSEY